MQVKILPFGVLKDWLGASASAVELPEGSTVAELLEHLRTGRHSPHPSNALRGIAVSINAEYVSVTQELHEGDEVGLLPPVSGGTGNGPDRASAAYGLPGATLLCREPIDAEKVIAAIKNGEDGAVVVFDGIVRNNTRGRQTFYLDYEAYEEMAEKQMRELASEARTRFGVRQVTLVHRLGRLEIGETSVLIVVASAHRAQAFEACRWLIDSLKKTVPIWKKETFADGVVWAGGEPFPAGLAVELEETPHGS